LLQGNFDAYDIVDAMPDYVPEVKYPRTPGTFPAPEDNKYGAWYVKSTIKGAASGKLAGKTVGVERQCLCRRRAHDERSINVQRAICLTSMPRL
jgi:hypothetical protein